MRILFRKATASFTLLAVLACIPFTCFAQVIVSDAILEFKDGERLITDIAVGNYSADKTIQIKSVITEVINPASENAEHLSTKTLFTAPEMFTLSPKTQRAVRIASQERPENKERIFRIVFSPKVIEQGGVATSKIHTLTTTGVMVILNPPSPTENLTWERTEDRITFTNNGNTNLVLRRDGFCAKEIQRSAFMGW